jgi:hypothetical protein
MISPAGYIATTTKGEIMPTISMFYGIMVAILFEDNDRHHLPHIHVRYSGDKASIAIEDGRLLAGNFPPKQLKMVQAWIEIHKDELFADWEMAVAGEEPFHIAPLQ